MEQASDPLTSEHRPAFELGNRRQGHK